MQRLSSKQTAVPGLVPSGTATTGATTTSRANSTADTEPPKNMKTLNSASSGCCVLQ